MFLCLFSIFKELLGLTAIKILKKKLKKINLLKYEPLFGINHRITLIAWEYSPFIKKAQNSRVDEQDGKSKKREILITQFL